MRRFAQWGTYTITDVASDELKCYEGRRVSDIAAEEDKSPFDALLDIAIADGLCTGFCTPLWRNSDDDWRLRVDIARNPSVILGASDAGAHLDMAAQFNYPTVFIENAVRRLKLLPLEEAVHLLTEVPATLYGLKDRGRIRPGARADMVIFDPAAIGSTPFTVRHDLPGGAMRIYAEGVGIDRVFVNGVEILTDGVFTGERPGTVLRSGRDTDATTAR
jgi:N-acyl-D-aspartate/D-glutamate deacylase